MLRRRMLLGLVCLGVVGGCWFVEALAQERQRERDRPPEARQRGDRQRRMAEFRRRMEDRMRQQLGATEEEWKVLQPRIEKVQQLQRQIRFGFRGFDRRMGRRDRGPGDRGPAEREQSEVEKKTEALRNLLDDEASSAAAIKAALDALRKAREQAEKDLAAARKELREVVTVRQEAQLVLMNILE